MFRPAASETLAEGAADEGDGAARAGEGQGQADVGIGGEQGQDAADQKGQPSRTSRVDGTQADGGEDAAADDPADADREGAERAER